MHNVLSMVRRTTLAIDINKIMHGMIQLVGCLLLDNKDTFPYPLVFFKRGCMLEYNLKINNYIDDVQVSFYKKAVRRKDENNEVFDENNKQNNKSAISNNNDNLSVTWYNPKTCKDEVIPRGFEVIDKPFSDEKMLFPLEKYLTEDRFYSMDFDELKPFVDKQIEEEDKRKKYSNQMRTIRRTKQNLYKLARANEWELFVTFTFADEKYRNDFDGMKKYFTKKIDNVKQKNKLKFKYLLIPEQDKNGNWHFHGLFKDIQGLKLERAINPHTGQYILSNGLRVYNIVSFNSVGFNTATYVQNNAKVVRYILKYITKDMELNYPGKRKYLSSKGLSKGQEVVFLVDSEEEIMDRLNDVYAYDLTLKSEKQCINPYTDSVVTYKQFNK